MTKRQLFKRRVIELIHDLPYKEAIRKEFYTDTYYNRYRVGDWESNKNDFEGLPIRIDRVLQAIQNCDCHRNISVYKSGGIIEIDAFNRWLPETICRWKLTKDDGSGATDDDQTDQTIDEIYEIIKDHD